MPLAPILEVRFYATDQGREPVRDWLKSLPPDVRKAIGEDIKQGSPDATKCNPGITVHDMPPDSGAARRHPGYLMKSLTPDARKALRGRHQDRSVLHGFIKKSGKTPKDDLKLALRRAKEVHHG